MAQDKGRAGGMMKKPCILQYVLENTWKEYKSNVEPVLIVVMLIVLVGTASFALASLFPAAILIMHITTVCVMIAALGVGIAVAFVRACRYFSRLIKEAISNCKGEQ